MRLLIANKSAAIQGGEVQISLFVALFWLQAVLRIINVALAISISRGKFEILRDNSPGAISRRSTNCTHLLEIWEIKTSLQIPKYSTPLGTVLPFDYWRLMEDA